MNPRKNVDEATFVIIPANSPAAKTIEQISLINDAMNRLDKAFHLAYYHNRYSRDTAMAARGMVVCALLGFSGLGFSRLVVCQGPPFQTKVSQDQSVDCLIIHTLYPHLYRIQFKDAAVRDHESSLGCNLRSGL